MTKRSTPQVVLGTASLCTSALLFSFLLFSLLRPAQYQPGLASAAAGNSTAAAAAYSVNATTLVRACESACGGATTCAQSPTTGIVFSAGCTSCGATYSLANGTCLPPSICTAYHFCSTAEAALMVRVYNSLVSSALQRVGGNTSLVTTLYPVGATLAMTQSSNWTAVLQPVFHTPAAAIGMLNLFLAAKFQQLALGSSQSPVPFFGDADGYWVTSFAVYQQAVPPNFAAYLLAFKQLMCARTWLQLGTGCKAPT